MDGFLGEIRAFAFNYAPKLWAYCDGAELPIKQNAALFSLIGVTYGGNGVSTFRLPDLQGRSPICMDGKNAYPYAIGRLDGAETVTINDQTMATHAHAMGAQNIAGNFAAAFHALPANVGDARAGATIPIYAKPGTMVTLAANTIPAGGGSNASHTNMQPSLAMTFCICTSGMFPSSS